jgi:hypothetical protein
MVKYCKILWGRDHLNCVEIHSRKVRPKLCASNSHNVVFRAKQRSPIDFWF